MARDLEDDPYWRVESWAPTGYNERVGEATTHVKIRHRIATWQSYDISGAYSVASIRRDLPIEGPQYAKPEYQDPLFSKARRASWELTDDDWQRLTELRAAAGEEEMLTALDAARTAP